MGYSLNRVDDPVFTAVSKPLLTEFGIHHRLESCGQPSCSRIAGGLGRETAVNHCVKSVNINVLWSKVKLLLYCYINKLKSRGCESP